MAISAFERALQISPDNARAHFNLGVLFHTQGDHTKAGLFFEHSAALHEARGGKGHPEAEHARALASKLRETGRQ